MGLHQLVLPTQQDVNQVDTSPSNKSDEREMRNRRLLKWWHERLGHVSMHTIQHMASKGILPSSIAKCKIPVCQACLYGMMTKKPWRTRAIPKPMSIAITEPGDCVSVDQLESRLPGLLGQLKGIPTKARYKVATVFVDHISDLTFIHLQQTTNAMEALEAKRQFESYLRSHGVIVKHYHADNGRFIETTWVDDIKDRAQDMSYAGVGAHHQNGRAEKRIRDVQDLARSSKIHAMRRWPSAIDVRLCPYAIRRQLHHQAW
jgi:GAG-pre-integrase domain